MKTPPIAIRMTVVVLTLVSLGWILTSGMMSHAADDVAAHRQSSKLPEPVVDTHDLMHLFNEPLYRLLKEQMKEEPAADTGWKTIEERGLQTAEVANLVAMRNEAREWQELAADLQSAGLQLNEAAKSKDFSATKSAYREILNSCNACHRTEAEDAPQLKP